MKIVRYREGTSIKWGVLEESRVREFNGNPFDPFRLTSKIRDAAEIHLQAPCLPSKIVAVGLNYRDHAEELKAPLPTEPIIFLKPSTSVIGPGASIIYPGISKRVDYEGELAIVVGRPAKFVPEDQAAEVILGYTCFNDVTARDLQPLHGQWTLSKSFDTFSPLGPCIETEIKPSHLEISTYVNGEKRQGSNTKNLLFGPERLVSYISQVMTLLPGDVIATGTPSGVGPMRVGDTVEVIIEGIGSLRNTVVA